LPAHIVTQNRIGFVLFWMTGALLSFSTMAVCIRGLAGVLNVFEILSIRSGSGFLVLGTLALLRPALRREIRLDLIRIHLLRNTIHFGAQVGWTKSLTLLPLATVFALEFTTPAWVALLAVLILGERMTITRAATVLLGLLGVIIIVRPGLGDFQPAALLVIAAAVGFAVTFVATKKLTGTESTFAILFWMNLIQLPMNLVGSDPLFLTKLQAGHLLPVAGVIVSGLASHFCITNAFRSGDALLVVPLDFLRLPLIALVGWMFYAEGLDALVFVGAGFILAGIILNVWVESRRRDVSSLA
jgi:drug/metabolite transporter (DMT)-like permease